VKCALVGRNSSTLEQLLKALVGACVPIIKQLTDARAHKDAIYYRCEVQAQLEAANKVGDYKLVASLGEKLEKLHETIAQQHFSEESYTAIVAQHKILVEFANATQKGLSEAKNYAALKTLNTKLDELNYLGVSSAPPSENRQSSAPAAAHTADGIQIAGVEALQGGLDEKINTLLAGSTVLNNMLQTLIAGTHAIPTLAIVLPEISSGWKSVTHPMRLLRNRFRLFFLCSHTKQIAPCGPDGNGYKIQVTKKWVRDVAPVLRVGLVLVKVALQASGLPLPMPDLCSSLTGPKAQCMYLDAALQVVTRAFDDDPSQEHIYDDKEKLLTEYDVSGTANELQLQEGSRKAYETIKKVLDDDGHDIAMTCGLRQVICPNTGKTAWVLDNDATEQAWRDAVANAASGSLGGGAAPGVAAGGPAAFVSPGAGVAPVVAATGPAASASPGAGVAPVVAAAASAASVSPGAGAARVVAATGPAASASPGGGVAPAVAAAGCACCIS
jgi:hypothetical protein